MDHINYGNKEYIHPADAKALQAMQAIPGFNTVSKKVMELGMERMMYGENLGQNLRLSENQLPEIYNHLPPIVEKLGIPMPELYLVMDPEPNAYTSGDTNIFICINSGLLDVVNDEELDAVLAHECGHIICHHVLYHSMGQDLIDLADELSVLGALIFPVELAYYQWERKSELSADRVSALITSPETVMHLMGRFASGHRRYSDNINYDEWLRQAADYEQYSNNAGTWNKIVQRFMVMNNDHPLTAQRVSEIMKWGQTDSYKKLRKFLDDGHRLYEHGETPVHGSFTAQSFTQSSAPEPPVPSNESTPENNAGIRNKMSGLFGKASSKFGGFGKKF